MKRHKVNLAIGEGMFSNEPIGRVIEFADGSEATFYLTPVTGDLAVELEEAGIVFAPDGFASQAEALRASRAFLSKVLHGWSGWVVDGVEIPYNEENVNRIAATALGADLVNIASKLAVETREANEGN